MLSSFDIIEALTGCLVLCGKALVWMLKAQLSAGSADTPENTLSDILEAMFLNANVQTGFS